MPILLHTSFPDLKILYLSVSDAWLGSAPATFAGSNFALEHLSLNFINVPTVLYVFVTLISIPVSSRIKLSRIWVRANSPSRAAVSSPPATRGPYRALKDGCSIMKETFSRKRVPTVGATIAHATKTSYEMTCWFVGRMLMSVLRMLRIPEIRYAGLAGSSRSSHLAHRTPFAHPWSRGPGGPIVPFSILSYIGWLCWLLAVQ